MDGGFPYRYALLQPNCKQIGFANMASEEAVPMADGDGGPLGENFDGCIAVRPRSENKTLLGLNVIAIVGPQTLEALKE